MAIRDFAFSVRELGQRSFGWVIFEGTGETGAFASYVQFELSESQFATYSDALLAGFSRLRALGGRDGPIGFGPLS